MSRPLITLTTDFGLSDSYVAQMKACLLRLAPACLPVDISHEISPGDIAHAAYLLADAAPVFPDNSVHLVVVDPGVGTPRRRLVLRLLFDSGTQWFIGPDNGVFSRLLASAREAAAWEIRTEDLGIADGGLSTFDGRDVFAPTAARLARGDEIGEFGREISCDDLCRISIPEARKTEEIEGLLHEGELVYFDRFGNAISNLPCEPLPIRGACEVQTANSLLTVLPFENYDAIPEGHLGLIRNSQNYWEISAKGASARESGGLSLGMILRIQYAS